MGQIHADIGHGLRDDLERLEGKPELTVLIQSLRRHGVDVDVIVTAMAQLKMS